MQPLQRSSRLHRCGVPALQSPPAQPGASTVLSYTLNLKILKHREHLSTPLAPASQTDPCESRGLTYSGRGHHWPKLVLRTGQHAIVKAATAALLQRWGVGGGGGRAHTKALNPRVIRQSEWGGRTSSSGQREAPSASRMPGQQAAQLSARDAWLLAPLHAPFM